MDNKVAWGIIGAGGIADRRTLPGMMLSKNAYPAALMEVDKQRAKALAEKYRVNAYYTSVEELLADKNVQAVYIASPVIFHKEQVLAAAKAGKHILCEKPLCLTSKDSEEITQFCYSRDVFAATGFMMRYHSLHRKIKQFIKDGKIGDIVSCRAQMNCWYPGNDGGWSGKKAKAGGGALIDMGIHCIDLLEYLTNSVCTQVFALCETKTFSYDVEDSANTILKLSNGATAYVDVNFNIPDNACPCRLEVFGTKGSLIAEGTIGQEEIGLLKCVFSNQSEYDAAQKRISLEKIEYSPENGNLYEKEISSFSNSILNGCAVEVPMKSAAHAQRVVEAAYKSSETLSAIAIND